METTKPSPFEKEYGHWLTAAAAQSSHVLVLNIAPTTAETEAHSPGLAKSIAMYNRIILKTTGRIGGNVTLVDVHTAIQNASRGIDAFISADGHHITEAGHEFCAELLFQEARRVLERPAFSGDQH